MNFTGEGMLKYKLIFLLLLVAVKSFAVSGSGSGVNPFNQFISPLGGVNLLSGDVVFPYEVVKLPGINGMDAGITLSYSSNVYKNVRAKNDRAPTSWAGLGWRLGFGSIICDHNNTRIDYDDHYYWISPEGVRQQIRRNSNGFYLEKNPFWKVKRYPATLSSANKYKIDGWILTDPNGRKYIYGNPSSYAPDHNAVRNSLCWETFTGKPDLKNGYVGKGSSGTPYQFPFQWDVSVIEDLFGNQLKFEYDTIGEILQAHGTWESPFYTKASYLRKINTPQGDSIVLYTGDKNALEYLDPKRYKSTEPDAYIEFYEKKALDSIKVFVKGHLFRKFLFCYDFISIAESGHFMKRLLTSITEIPGDRKESKKVRFEYYDKVDEYEEDKENYNLGALKKIITPHCAQIEYRYEKFSCNNTSPKLFNPSDEGKVIDDFSEIRSGVVENGNEYFVMLRNYSKKEEGSSTTKYFTNIEIYTWSGFKWNRQYIHLDKRYFFGEVKIGAGHDYFAVNIDGLLDTYFWNKWEKKWEKRSPAAIDIDISKDWQFALFKNHFFVYKYFSGDDYTQTYRVNVNN
jgi:hypothetical protein